MYTRIYNTSCNFVESLRANKKYYFLVKKWNGKRGTFYRFLFWFYGFKLHGVCSEKGTLEPVVFTSGNVNNSKMIGKVTENMKCWFYWDAGYLKKCKELARLAESGQFICAATRQNMNRIISSDQWYHFRKLEFRAK